MLCYMSITFNIKILGNTTVSVLKRKVLMSVDKNCNFVNSKLIHRTSFYNLTLSLPNIKKNY